MERALPFVPCSHPYLSAPLFQCTPIVSTSCFYCTSSVFTVYRPILSLLLLMVQCALLLVTKSRKSLNCVAPLIVCSLCLWYMVSKLVLNMLQKGPNLPISAIFQSPTAVIAMFYAYCLHIRPFLRFSNVSHKSIFDHFFIICFIWSSPLCL
jgi:hypothetical protein